MLRSWAVSLRVKSSLLEGRAELTVGNLVAVLIFFDD
jgi:hypothetical protein